MGHILFYAALIYGMINASISIKSNEIRGSNDECVDEKFVLRYNEVSICKQGEIFELPSVSGSQPTLVKYTSAKVLDFYILIAFFHALITCVYMRFCLALFSVYYYHGGLGCTICRKPNLR